MRSPTVVLNARQFISSRDGFCGAVDVKARDIRVVHAVKHLLAYRGDASEVLHGRATRGDTRAAERFPIPGTKRGMQHLAHPCSAAKTSPGNEYVVDVKWDDTKNTQEPVSRFLEDASAILRGELSALKMATAEKRPLKTLFGLNV